MPTFGGGSEKCVACSKTVYATEKIVVEDKDDKRTYHKNCLRCSHCSKPLSLGNYASMGGVMYCKPHFKQLFASKGNYDEGFGKDKLTSKWAPTAVVGVAPSSAASFIPVESAGSEKEKPEKKDTPSAISSRFKTGGQDKCSTCSKTVYATERIVVEDKEDKKIFHKICFRCTHCSVVLTLGNYAGLGGKFFCKPHFKQLFASKGNYDEGFGKQKHTAKWNPSDSEASATTSSSLERESSDSPIGTPPVEREREHVDSKEEDISPKHSHEEESSSHDHSHKHSEEEEIFHRDEVEEHEPEPEPEPEAEAEAEPEREERSYDDEDDN